MSTLRLPVALTDADRLVISAEMSAAQTALEEVEAEKKAATKDFNEAIKEKKATIHDRNGVLRAGVIVRDVEVETRPDPDTGKRVTWRLDTMTPVRSTDLDPDERQVLMDLPPPGSKPVGLPSEASDEQREATTPDEAEALRAERLAGERAERISAAVVEARAAIEVRGCLRWPGQTGGGLKASLVYGDKTFEAEAGDEEAARQGVVLQLTEHLEAQEDQAQTWADVAAASKAEQDRQEVERLAAEQAADEAAAPKRGFKKGLVAPTRKKRVKVVDASDNEITPPEDAAEPPTPGDDGPVATMDVAVNPETGLPF